MSKPIFLTIKQVVCHSMNDFTGADDLVGVLGPLRFDIGSFEAGNTYDVEVTTIVPEGATLLQIKESDFSGDDDLGVIDLSEVMDVDTTKNIQGDDANYDITYFVQSESTN